MDKCVLETMTKSDSNQSAYIENLARGVSKWFIRHTPSKN